MEQNIANQIESILHQSIDASLLQVINESKNHSRAGDNTHFKVVIVSDDFIKQSMIQRHKKLNTMLEEIFKQVHALSIRAYTQTEWDQLIIDANSPVCVSINKS